MSDNKEFAAARFATALEAALIEYAIEPLSETQTDQLMKHYSMLHRWNRRLNLTRIIEPEQAARLHYAESLFGGRFINDARALIDAGSGAGFPAVPLAVLRPGVRVTALEANQKKAVFLNEVKDALALANFTVVRSRLEEFDLSSYDLLTSRAIDRAEEMLPSVINRLETGQRFMLYCAPDLLAIIDQRAAGSRKVESHSIPGSKARLIAIFSRG